MLKRTLIAIAVMSMLAVTVQAQELPSKLGPFSDSSGNERGFKIDPQKMDIYWPFEWKSVELCTIPVYLELGILVHVNKCQDQKVILKQVDCTDIGKGNAQFPCYSGCTGDIQIRTNFPIKLGLSKSKVGSVLKDWSAYWAGDFDGKLNYSSSWQKVKICVDAWNTQLFNEEATGAAGQRVKVGEVTITVKPQV
jgi:hypothetical protein